MKHLSLVITILLLIPLFNSLTAQAGPINQPSRLSTGEILSLSASDAYPTLSEPVSLLVTVQGGATERFNETILISDEFHGLVATDGHITWIAGNVTEPPITLTIGNQASYKKKIPWYPSIVGNHTFHVIAGSFPVQNLTMSVSFDVEGVISPSFGHPSILTKDTTNELQVTMSETRTTTEAPLQILATKLQAGDCSPSYSLDNMTSVWRTWVNAGPDHIQDELIGEYNISSIPDGFYDIIVETSKQSYTWQHAVKIQTNTSKEITIAQLTDIHIGKYANFANKKKELANLITYMNENIHPDFVIVSGDSVDWYNKKSLRNVFNDFKGAFLACDAPVFTTPGNHERYGNSLLFLYYPFTNLTSYLRFVNPLSDYSFDYGNVNFVFLDSGYDYSRWEIQPQIWNTTPEGSGLTATQIFLLNTTWGDAQLNQIISMHHPAVYDSNDTGLGAVPNNLPSGNNNCIAFNRGVFIDYCIKNNVSLVLTGHTHENHVFNSVGKTPLNLTAWPLFIQTRSSTLSGSDNGGRILHIKNGVVLSYEYLAFA